MKKTPVLCILFAIAFFLTFCGRFNQKVDVTTTQISLISTEIITNIEIRPPSVTSTPPERKHIIPLLMTRPPYPTPSVSHMIFLGDSLKDENCQLPCYLRITPGQTYFNEAKRQLEKTGMGYFSKLSESYIDHDISIHTFKLNFNSDNGEITRQVLLYVYENLVIRMNITVRSWKAPSFNELWSQYSINGLIKDLGKPDEVYFWPNQDSGNNIWVKYDNEGILLKNHSSTTKENLVCPRLLESTIQGVSMVMFDPSYLDALNAFEQILDTKINFHNGILEIEPDYLIPIEIALKITSHEFYEQIITDPEICFERVD
jgi:hypothetical protein